MCIYVAFSFLSLFAAMETPGGAWGGTGELYAFSRMVQMRIGVFDASFQGKVGDWMWFPSERLYVEKPVILLYHENESHFQLVDSAVLESEW